MGSIDNSPPERVPHEEYIGKDLAKARLLMPLNVVHIENEIEEIKKNLNFIIQNFSYKKIH